MSTTSYIQVALDKLSTLNIFPAKQELAPVIPMLTQIAKYDNIKVTEIASTLQHSSTFNAIIRDELNGMDVATRYADITTQFDSIREDAKQMAEWMADGKLDATEKIAYYWMKMRRGSIPDRFNKIRDTYLEVSDACNKQITRETTILDAYLDFRMALKSAEVDAQSVLKTAAAQLEAKKDILKNSNEQVDQAATASPEDKAAHELRRDEALRDVQAEDKSYQIAKDIADDLKTAYNTAELVFARLQQTHTVKERLYQRSVVFFSTNEVVLTGLSASFTSSAGLSEATNTMEAMKSGMNKGLEAMATIGSQELNKAIATGYGSTLQVSSVKSLADAIVEFQEKSTQLITELRTESSKASQEIEAVTEDAKKRFIALTKKGV